MIPSTQAIAKETRTVPLAILLSPLSFVAGLENPLLPLVAQVMGLGMCLMGPLLELLETEREEGRKLKWGLLALEKFTVEGTRRGRLDRLQYRRQNEESMEVFVI